jgi:polynucleotide 5'-hydroxyl-kinase GRC3/NOL9
MEQAQTRGWSGALDEATAAAGLVVIIGAADTGKTTLALAAANRALERGMRVGIIDADVGQSEIGPPGTIGLALPQAPAASATEWHPAALAFVGATAPPGRLLDVAVGTRRLVDEAHRRGAQTTIVDTSGLVRGAIAVKLKLAKLELLQPAIILALQLGQELAPILRVAPAVCRATVITLPLSERARAKPPALRRARRASRFAQYLQESREHLIDPRQVPVTDGWLFAGRALEPPRLRAAAATLGSELLYGEETGGGIRLVTPGAVPRLVPADCLELFGGRRVAATPAGAFQNLLVGLLEEGGRLAEIGLIQRVDFASRRLHVLSPLRREGALRALRYGRVRLRLDGSEIGPVRPGDL